MQTLSLTPIQLKAYRDDVVNVLYKQIHLLEEIQKSDFFKISISDTDQKIICVQKIFTIQFYILISISIYYIFIS